MGLSKYPDSGNSILRELALLDENPIMLDGLTMKPSGCFRLSGNPPQVIYNTNCPDDLKNKIAAILSKYHNRPAALNYFYTLEFEYENNYYSGRLTPEFIEGVDHPSSWVVVLNGVLFERLYKVGNTWGAAENAPPGLVQKLGRLIDDKQYHAAPL